MTPIEEIKSKIGIIDVVSGYVRLEKAGAQWKARCPFHHERTPSFYVSPDRGTYHCFGCQAHGDIFSFIENIEHIPFVEALHTLADRAQVSLSNYKKKEGDKEGRLIQLLEKAAWKYEDNLAKSVEAKDYLLSRGLSPESISKFRIGYAPQDWRIIFTYLMGEGYTPEEMVASGLVIATEDGKYYDRFRGRIMFPIENISGAIVGYTGRVLPVYDDGKTGKYVNTPETSVYHKGNILYNYNRAKSTMAKTRTVVLVEGQMDVVMSTQAGIANVLAVSGTAFTEYHVKMIHRLADNVILSFDNDKAGQAARDRAIQMCLAEGLDVYIPMQLHNKSETATDISVDKSQPKDAADIVRNNSADWVYMIENAKTLFEYLCDEALNISEAKDKIHYIRNKILKAIYYIPSPLARNQYLELVSSRMHMSVNVLSEELASLHLQNDNAVANNIYTESQTELDIENKSKNKIYLNNKLQYIALGRHLGYEVESEHDYPDELIIGTIMHIESMGQSGEDLEKMYIDLKQNLFNKNNKEKIRELTDRLRTVTDSDESMAILEEISRLRKE